MTDDTQMPQPEAGHDGVHPSAGGPEGSWDEVLERMRELGESIGRWARTAASDPNYRRHANELKGHLENIAGTVTEAVDDVAATEFGQSVKTAATTAGDAIKDAGQTVAREVSPSLAEAFRSAADGLRRAAAKMDEHVSSAKPAEAAASPESNPEDDG